MAIALYKPGATNIYTIVTTTEGGRKVCGYSGDPVEPYLADGYIMEDLDAVLPKLEKAQRETFCKPWDEITEELWGGALDCLPPVNWKREQDREIFQMSERTSGNITGHYARIGDRYFCANRQIGTGYAALYAEIEKAFSL